MADSWPWAENVHNELESIIIPEGKKAVDILGSFPKDPRANLRSLPLAKDGMISASIKIKTAMD